VLCLKKRGDAVAAGETVAQVHAQDDAAAARAADGVLAAYTFADDAPAAAPIILETIG